MLCQRGLNLRFDIPHFPDRLHRRATGVNDFVVTVTKLTYAITLRESH